MLFLEQETYLLDHRELGKGVKQRRTPEGNSIRGEKVVGRHGGSVLSVHGDICGP